MARSFGDTLARWRGDSGLSMAQLAEAVGVTKQYVSDLEHGRTKNPSARVVVGLARALRVSEDRVLRAIEEGGF